MIEVGLTYLLNTDAALSSLVTGRIYPLLLPEKPVFPAITYQVISSTPVYTLDGALGLSKTRIQYDAWATSYADAKSVSAAVRSALDDYAGTLDDGTLVSHTEVVNTTDYYDSDARLYRVQTDFTFWQSL